MTRIASDCFNSSLGLNKYLPAYLKSLSEEAPSTVHLFFGWKYCRFSTHTRFQRSSTARFVFYLIEQNCAVFVYKIYTSADYVQNKTEQCVESFPWLPPRYVNFNSTIASGDLWKLVAICGSKCSSLTQRWTLFNFIHHLTQIEINITMAVVVQLKLSFEIFLSRQIN